MRALFEDVAINSGVAANSGLVIHEVGIPTAAANRRDLWLRWSRVDASTVQLRAYLSRTLVGTPASYVASVNVTVPTVRTEVTLVRNGTKTPDLSGLDVIVTATAVPASSSSYYYWAYTAAPDLVTMDNLADLLAGYTGDGQALDGFTAGAIFVGDETEAEALPVISLLSQPSQMELSSDTGRIFTAAIPWEAHVVISSLEAPQAAWRRCREYQAAVESILSDECRQAYGEVRIHRTGGDGPGPVAAKPGVFVGVVRGVARYYSVFREDIYPRS